MDAAFFVVGGSVVGRDEFASIGIWVPRCLVENAREWMGGGWARAASDVVQGANVLEGPHVEGDGGLGLTSRC